MNTHTLEEFRDKFRVEELTLYSNDSWTWSLRPTLPTIGSGVISLNRYALHFSDVSDAEMKDLGEIIKVVEKTLSSAFDFQIMNYLMLMMVDHHVHYHAIPRYEGEKSFGGVSWTDSGWPALPAMGDNQHGDNSEVISMLIEHIKNSIN